MLFHLFNTQHLREVGRSTKNIAKLHLLIFNQTALYWKEKFSGYLVGSKKRRTICIQNTLL